MVLYWSAFLYHIVIGNEISMLATSLPILMTYAQEHGINPLTLGMIWTFGAGPKIFIYESAVLVVGYSYGYFTNKDMLKVGRDALGRHGDDPAAARAAVLAAHRHQPGDAR